MIPGLIGDMQLSLGSLTVQHDPNVCRVTVENQ